MPDLSDYHLNYHLVPNPRSEPAAYPGDRLAFDYLLQGDQVFSLVAGADGWQVDAHDRAPVGPGWPARRLPVVAFGSNAAPAQLAAKFGADTGGLPVTRARLHGFDLGHSPHVSIPGYLPWVLFDSPGSVVECAVLWLDDGQRAVLDATEPNYDLVPVDAGRYPMVVQANGERIDYSAYRGRWGALRWPGEDRPASAGTQAEVFDRLGALSWFRDLLGEGNLHVRQRRLAGDAALRDRVREELAAREMVVPDGWAAG